MKNNKIKNWIFFTVICLAVFLPVVGQSTTQSLSAADITKKTAKLEMPFIANQGQMDARVAFYAKTFGGTVFVTKDGEIVYNLPARSSDSSSYPPFGKRGLGRFSMDARGITLLESLVGGKTTGIYGEEMSTTKVSHFIGNDPATWRYSIPTYGLVSLGEVYQGIELKLKAYGNNVEKLFYVKPGTSPNQIQMKLSGANDLRVNAAGELELTTDLGAVTFSKPIAYQEINGKRVDVPASYAPINAELTSDLLTSALHNRLASLLSDIKILSS